MKWSSVALFIATCAPFNAAIAAEWTFGPSLITPRAGHAVAIDERGNIYVVGGKKSWTTPPFYTDSVEMLAFDGQQYADAWIELAPISSERRGMSAICTNGFLYVIGGHDADSTCLTIVERLDLTQPSATWETIASLKTPQTTAAITLDKLGRVWVIGGGACADGGSSMGLVEIYDPARTELGWQYLDAELNQDRVNHGATTDRHGRIYVFGGTTYPSGNHLASVERFDPRDPLAGWVMVASQPRPDSNEDQAVVGADGRIYVAGGWLPGFSNLVNRYDPLTDSWESWVPMNIARSELRLILGADGRIFAIGGAGPGGPDALHTVEILTAPCHAAQVRPSHMDFNADGTIDVDDLLALIAVWGFCP